MPSEHTPPTSPTPKSSFERIHRYTQEEPDRDDPSSTVLIELEVTRGNGVRIRVSRTQKKRKTEIEITLGEDERRDLARLVG